MERIIEHIPLAISTVALTVIAWAVQDKTNREVAIALTAIVAVLGCAIVYQRKISKLKKEIKALQPFKDRYDAEHIL